MRLGDINGDGKMEIVMGQPMPQPGAYTPQQVVCVTAYDLKGKQLWQYGTPGTSHGASSDIPIQVYDMDGDGKSEVFANMSDSEMTVLDGTTGKLVRTIPLHKPVPTTRCVRQSARQGLATGHPGQDPLLPELGDRRHRRHHHHPPNQGGTVLWHHAFLPSDSSGSDRGTGHYPLVYDWNGDGKDEVMAATSSCRVTARRYDHQHHVEPGPHSACGRHRLSRSRRNPANGIRDSREREPCRCVSTGKTGTQLWQDNNTVDNQGVGMATIVRPAWTRSGRA